MLRSELCSPLSACSLIRGCFGVKLAARWCSSWSISVAGWLCSLLAFWHRVLQQKQGSDECTEA
eukprot:scaffold236193_cov21-Tisochrysis_lutea.AAC.1